MKILHVIEIRGIGGAEKMLIEFLQRQALLEHKIYCLLILTRQHENVAYQIGKKLSACNVNIYFQVYSSYKSIFKLIWQVKNHIKKINPDITHTHLRLADLCLAILKFLKLKIPVITTMHGYGDEVQNQIANGSVLSISNTPRFYLVRFILKHLNAYAFISDFLLKFCIDNRLILNEKKSTRIDNAIIINKGIIKKRVFDKSDIKIVLPGRLIGWKGHKYAFEAIKILSQKYPGIKLDCYGIGPDEKILINLISSMNMENLIELKGFNENIIEKIKEYDLMVVPSLFESFGIVFLDAFTAQLPVVAFDIPAGNEIIDDGVDGLLALPKNSASLAEKIELLIEDDVLRSDILLNATKKLKHKYDMGLMVEKYLSLYKEVINEK